MAQNNDGPGKRLKREEAKNVSFGFMRPEVSPLNQQQFMQVARGETMPQQTGINAPIVFGQKPGSIGEKIGRVLTLGEKAMPGQGYQLTPSETAKQTAIDLATGEAIGRGAKMAAPYVKAAAKKIITAPSTKVILQSAEQRLKNPESYKLLTGSQSGIRGKIAELIHNGRLKLIDRQSNLIQDEVRRLNSAGKIDEARRLSNANLLNQSKKTAKADLALHNFRQNYSGLPIEHTGKIGGEGSIYKNKLNPNEYIKVGDYFGNEQSMKNLIEVGGKYSPKGAKIAFPTNYVYLGKNPKSVDDAHRFAQFMPKIEGFSENAMASIKDKENALKVLKELDELGVGVDYAGYGNLGSAGGDLGVVDLAYVGPPGKRVVPQNLQDYIFKLNKPIVERIE
jgi:hypothetical protein